jgi:hypothetical protein
MFKVGDIVRCITDKYGITTYKRPCEIVGIPNKENIDVRCLGGDSSIFEVRASLFEFVPKHEILHKGMYVEDKYEEKYKFKGYGARGIRVEHHWREFLDYDDIVYHKHFKV